MWNVHHQLNDINQSIEILARPPVLCLFPGDSSSGQRCLYTVGMCGVPRIASCPGVWRVGGSGLRSCLGDFRRLVALSSTLSSPDPLFSGLPQSSPSFLDTLATAFLTERVFYNGWSGPPQGQRSLTSFFSRRRGSTHSQSVYRLSHRPSLSSNPAFLPRRVLSGLPEP